MKAITNYFDAVNYFANNRILCNNISEIDPTFYDNIRFNLEDSNGEIIDIFQYYITDFQESEVEYLEQRFSLFFSFSELLDCFILCVNHYGTSWKGVYVTDNEVTEE